MNKDYIVVDGSMGEGGGQVLRASLALSMALGRPFRITNIRAGRPKPGMKRQHLACVQAARDICGAEITGAGMGSTELTFAPGKVSPGEYRFDIGSGGSCTLVLQAVLPPLLTASGPSRITVTGGTHVPFAPSFEFLQQTLLPWLEKLGPRLSASLGRPGFMQVGGGSITVDIAPVPVLNRLEQLEACACGELLGAEGRIYLCNLEANIAHREALALQSKEFATLGLTASDIHLENNYSKRKGPEGPGNAVLVSLRHAGGTTVCSGIGQRGHSAESVARQAADRALAFAKAEVPVERHLADQLIVPLALAGGGRFLTEKPSLHATTCMELLPLFTDIKVKVSQNTGQQDAKRFLVTLE